MNLLKLIESFTNEGVLQSLSAKTNRRESFSQFGKVGAGAALAAVPFISLFTSTKANAATAAFAADNDATCIKPCPYAGVP